MHHTTNPEGGTSVLASLRSLNPNRPLQLSEALRVAELQANRLLELRGALDLPVPTTVITGLPRITAEHDADLPADAASGSSDWDWRRRSWVISLNPTEPRTRRRFTLFHEYKHILDHGSPGLASTQALRLGQKPAAEVVADYFAGCVLMPKRLVKAAYCDGIQQPRELAELFDVSTPAMLVRLSQIGLAPSDGAVQASRLIHRYQPRRSGRPASYYYRTATVREPGHLEVGP